MEWEIINDDAIEACCPLRGIEIVLVDRPNDLNPVAQAITLKDTHGNMLRIYQAYKSPIVANRLCVSQKCVKPKTFQYVLTGRVFDYRITKTFDTEQEAEAGNREICEMFKYMANARNWGHVDWHTRIEPVEKREP